MHISHTAYPDRSCSTFNAWSLHIAAVRRAAYKGKISPNARVTPARQPTPSEAAQQDRLVKHARFLVHHADLYRKFRKR